jgi:hypothetical protein
MVGRKCINDFSALSSSNVRTEPEMNIRDASFELKPALINMVQQIPFCGKASKDANAHLQHFFEICSTFTIRGVTQDAVCLRLFPFSLLGKVKQWFYSNKEAVSTWEKCSNAFLVKYFSLSKTNALRNKISTFQQLMDETIAEAWERLQDYISVGPHHAMEEWFIIQSFYHGLIHTTREHIDAIVGGSFFALGIEEAHKLIEKIGSNQSWDDERTPSCTRKVHQLEEVDMLTAKIDPLMKKLENPRLDHFKMVDAQVICEECGEIGHMRVNCMTVYQDANFVGHSNNGFRPNQVFNSGWNKPSFPFDKRQQGGNGQNFNRNEPQIRDIIRDQLRINDEFGKKIHATEKLLENISAKMEIFTVATQNHLSFNKMLETQI